MTRMASVMIAILAVGMARSDDSLPRDKAVLELIGLPPAARVTLDKRDEGTKRRFEFPGLDANGLHPHEVTLEFPGGAKVTHSVLLRGGWHVRLPVDAPNARRVQPVMQVGHQLSPADLAFSPNGRMLVTAGGRLAILWDAQTGRRLRDVTLNHEGNVVAFSPDNTQFLVGCGMQGSRSQDLGNLMNLMGGKTGDAKVDAAAAAAARRAQAALEAMKKLTPMNEETIVCDVRTGRKVLTLPSETGGVGSACFSPDGRWIATSSSYMKWGKEETRVIGAVTLWDRRTGRLVRSWPHSSYQLTSLQFSATSDQLIAVQVTNEGSEVIRWDLSSGRRVGGFKLENQILASSLDSTARRLLTFRHEKLELFDASSGQLEQSIALTDAVPFNTQIGARLSPDGQSAAYCTAKNAIVLDLASRRELFSIAVDDHHLLRVRFSPDGKRLAVTQQSGAIRLYDMASRRLVRVLRGRGPDGYGRATLSPDGRYLAIRRSEGVIVWDLRAGRRIATANVGRAEVHSIPFSADGRRMAVDDNDRKETAIVETATGRVIQRLRLPGDNVRGTAIGFAANGGLLVDYEERLALWDVDANRMRWIVPSKGRFGPNAQFRSDHTVLVGCEDGRVRSWDLRDGRIIRTFPGRFSNPDESFIPMIRQGSHSFTVDGKLMYVASPNGDSLNLWDVEAGRTIATMKMPKGLAVEAAFTQGDRYLIANSGYGMVVFDWRRGREVHRIDLGSQPVMGLTRFIDGRYMLLATTSGFVHVFDLAVSRAIGTLLNSDDDWIVTTPRGLFDGSAGGQQVVSYRLPSGEVVPVDRFYRDFYTAGLLPRLLAGEQPLPPAELGVSKAPRVRLVSAPPDGPIATRTVTLQVEIEDQGGGAISPWLTHNGRRLQLPGQVEQDGAILRRRFDVELAAGENLLEVRSASDDGSWESEPASVLLTYSQEVPAPKLFVLAVGVGQYAEESLNLKFAGVDARSLGMLFERRGRPLYAEVHVTTLVDQQATRGNIREALRGIARLAKPQDTVLVIFAGHGTVAAGGEYHFLPHDFRQRSDHLEEDVRRQGIGSAMLGEWLTAVPALKRLLVLDTCHSGAAVTRAASRNPFALREATQRLARSQGVFTIAAAASGQEAKEVIELGHGVLSYCLLAALNAVEAGPLRGQPLKPGEQRDVAEVLEWFQYASDNVPRLTRRYFGREQDVQFDLSGDSFPVLPLTERPRD